MASNSTKRGEEILRPGGVGAWILAGTGSVLMFAVGMSVYDGLPPASDHAAWIFIAILVAWFPLETCMEIYLYKVRERRQRPLWWTAKRQDNLQKTILFSAIGGFCFVGNETVGMVALLTWAMYAAFFLVPVFLCAELIDAATFRGWRALTARWRRPSKR